MRTLASMKTRIERSISSFIFLASIVVFLFSPKQSIAKVVINEIAWMGTDASQYGEWVELYNDGDTEIDLKGWRLYKRKGLSDIPIITLTKKIPPKNYYLIERTTESSKDPIPDIGDDAGTWSDGGLSNSGEFLSLKDDTDTMIDSVDGTNTWKINSNTTIGNNTKPKRTAQLIGTIWQTLPPTPKAKNIPAKTIDTKSVDIPDTAYLDVLTDFSVSGKDDDGDTVKYTWDFGDGHKSYKRETSHRYETEGTFSGSIMISDGTEETVTTFTIDVEKFKAPKVRMVRLNPNPSGKDTGAEYIEIENRGRKKVDLIGWSIATGWKKLINHPIRESFLIPKNKTRALTQEFSAFTLPNEKGRIELRAPNGKTVQKVRYNLKEEPTKEGALLVKEKGKKWAWITPPSTSNNQQLTDNKNQETTSLASDDGEQKKIDEEEEQLQRDTETITLKKQRGETLVSMKQNPKEAVRKLIGFGTTLQTPTIVLTLAPRVAGADDEIPSANSDIEASNFDINALINAWLEKE